MKYPDLTQLAIAVLDAIERERNEQKKKEDRERDQRSACVSGNCHVDSGNQLGILDLR